MKNMVYCLICNILLVALVILTSCSSEQVSIVPAPVHMEQAEGDFTFTDETVISTGDSALLPVGEWFAGLFGTSAGFVPEVKVADEDADIIFHKDTTMAAEAYRLEVAEDGIDIYASSAPGFFYALQTLRLALPCQISGNALVKGVDWTVPAMNINDAPRFEYRGLMVDVSRYFLPKEDLLEIIDCMAMLKLNNLHLHLTDDNGWRIEILKYPRLTSVGAWRADRGDTPFPDRKNPQPGEPTPIGGYYTQDDIREIVSYAAQRYINVIPEIDLPAHSNSALAAYPEYACPVVDRYIGVLPGLGGRNADIIYCAGNDDVFPFLEDVMDEVCDLFPSKYIHLGGDEAWKTYWKMCPLCQDRIEDEGLEDEEALQGWFMSRMNDYIRSKGRTMMGWDEVTGSEVPEGAVVFGWRGRGDAAIKAAEQGHRFVLTPSELLYLIRYQGPQWFEPLTYFGNSTLKDVYDYEPVGKTWKDEYRKLLMGIQGSMWTEFCDCPEDVTRQIFPRLVAVAEVAWSPEGAKDWGRFVEGLDAFNRHLDAKGVEYAKSMYNIQHRVLPMKDRLLGVNLSCERPDMVIRYTLDGSTPDEFSDIFPGNIKVGGSLVLKAAVFNHDGNRMGETLVLPLEWNKATASEIKGAKDASLLVNGVRGSLRQTDFEWVHCSGPSEFVIDMGKEIPVKRVSVGMLTNYGMAFHKPEEISVWISRDGDEYRKVGGAKWSDEEIFREGNFREDITFSFEMSPARYIKITAVGPEKCPDTHIRPGQTSKYCFDEVRVDARGSSGLIYGNPPVAFRGESLPIRFNSSKDTLSARERASERSRRNMMHWAGYSALDSDR